MSESLLAENNPEELAMQKEVQAHIRAAVASLPQHERIVTVLFYGWHYTYNEVSAFLNIPLSTVKKRLHSARQKLKLQLRTSLSDTIENARRAGESIEEAEEIILVRWLIQYIQTTKEMLQCMIHLTRPLSYRPWWSN
jgi:hypothetical protein